MSRLIEKSFAELSEAQQEVFNHIIENRPVKPEDGHIGGPFDIWLRSPEMGRRMVGLGGFFRFRTSVDRRYIELAILLTGAHWQAQFEWYAHAPMAAEAGLPQAIIDAIQVGEEPPLKDAGDVATYHLIHETLTNHRVTQATYDAAVAQFGEVGVAELIGVSGFYVSVSMTLNVFDVDLPAGAKKPFPDV